MLKAFAAYITYDLINPGHGSPLADALEFFIYDTIKMFVLPGAVVFIVFTIRTYFPPEKTKRILSHKKEFIGNILASLPPVPVVVGRNALSGRLSVVFPVCRSSREKAAA